MANMNLIQALTQTLTLTKVLFVMFQRCWIEDVKVWLDLGLGLKFNFAYWEHGIITTQSNTSNIQQRSAQLLCNSSNTSRRTSSDFQTPRRVENARQSRIYLTNFEVFWNRRTFSIPVFKSTIQFGLICVISFSDIDFLCTIASWIINELHFRQTMKCRQTSLNLQRIQMFHIQLLWMRK